MHDRHPHFGHRGPIIPGHEFTGIVRQVGAGVDGFNEGDLVASGAGISCGECVRCRRMRTNLCERYSTVGLSRDGALAEYVTVPAATCLQVAPYGLTPDAAALAQPMSIAVHARGLNRSWAQTRCSLRIARCAPRRVTRPAERVGGDCFTVKAQDGLAGQQRPDP